MIKAIRFTLIQASLLAFIGAGAVAIVNTTPNQSPWLTNGRWTNVK